MGETCAQLFRLFAAGDDKTWVVLASLPNIGVTGGLSFDSAFGRHHRRCRSEQQIRWGFFKLSYVLMTGRVLVPKSPKKTQATQKKKLVGKKSHSKYSTEL